MMVQNMSRAFKGRLHWIWGSLLMLFADVAMAASSGSNGAPSPSQIYGNHSGSAIISQIINAKPDNMMSVWIKDVFGTATHPTILARVGSISNVIALMLGVVIVGYIVVGGVLKTAHQGEVLGKQWSQVWLPIRIALAFGLIVPTGQGSMSMSQQAILKMAEIGNALAEVTWDEAVNEIASGTMIVNTPASMQSTLVDNELQSLSCDYRLSKIYTKHFVAYSLLEGPTLSSAQWSDSKAAGNDMTNNDIFNAANAKGTNVFAIRFGNGGQCGSIKLVPGVPNEVVSSGTSVTAAEQNPTSSVSVQMEMRNSTPSNYFDQLVRQANTAGFSAGKEEVVTSLSLLMPLARAINTTAGDSVTNSPNLIGLGVLKGITGNIKDNNGIYPALATDAAYLNTQKAKIMTALAANINKAVRGVNGRETQIKHAMKQGGWPAAGLWYFDISRLSNISAGVLQNLMDSSSPGDGNHICTPSNGFVGHIKSWWHDLASFVSGTDACPSPHNAVTAAGLVVKYSQQLSSKSISSNSLVAGGMMGDCSNNSCSTSSPSMISGFADSLAYYVLKGIMDMGSANLGNNGGIASLTNSTGIADPFVTLSSLGHGMLHLATTILVIGLLSMAGFDAIAYSGWGSNVGMGAGHAIVAGIGAIITTIIAPLATSGFTLAYLIPLLPILTWIMMLVNLLIVYIEAYIAVPLAVIQMATPEGEGISGTRMERAWALMAAMIARPPLMVVGLLASITVSYIGFGILNLFFWKAAKEDIHGFYGTIALITLYPTFAYIVIKRCVSVMNSLPDTILQWFSSGVSGAFTDVGGHTQQILGQKGALQQGFAAVGQGMSAAKQQRDRSRQKRLDDHIKAQSSNKGQ